MTFKFRLVETVREHYPKHLPKSARDVAVVVPPETIALATAVEAELQRFADHLRDGLRTWQAGIDSKAGRPEDKA